MLKRIWKFLCDTSSTFSNSRAATHGAALAFYAASAMAPVLLIVIAIAGFIYGAKAAEGAIFAQFRSVLGASAADLLQTAVVSASNKSQGIFATVIGAITLILTASGFFLELEYALNEIWQTKRPRSGFSQLLRQRLASFGLVVALGVLVIVLLLVDTVLTALGGAVDAHFSAGTPVAWAIDIIVPFIVYMAMFAAVFEILPAQALAWRDVLFGAAVTAFLFEIGTKLIGLYLGSMSAVSSLGAAGALLGILFWVYFSAQLVLFGAALTHTYFSGKTERSKAAEPQAVRTEQPALARK